MKVEAESAMRSVRIEAGRYAIVGASAFVIDYGVTWALLSYAPLLIANSIGFLLANTFNFLAAHRWVFGREFERHSLLGAYSAVLAVSLVGLAINNAVVWITVGLLVLPLLTGKVLATGAGMAWNFVARKIWIYKNNRP